MQKRIDDISMEQKLKNTSAPPKYTEFHDSADGRNGLRQDYHYCDF